MKIGLDFDGVITDCGKLKSDGAKRLYGIDIPAGQFKKEFIIGRGLLTPEQYRRLQEFIYDTREMGLLREPVDGALFFLPKLMAEGHIVSVITSQTEVGLKIVKEWSFCRGLMIDFVGVGLNKSKAQATAGLDVYVDDDLDKLEPLVGIVPNLFLFSWGYNQHLNEIGVAARVYSWEELYQGIQKIRGAH